MHILVRPTIQTAVGLYLGIRWIELLKSKLSYIKIFLRVDVSIFQFESSNAKQEPIWLAVAWSSWFLCLVVLRLSSFCNPETFAGLDFGFPYKVTMALGPHQPNGLLAQCNRGTPSPVFPFCAFCAGYKEARKLGPSWKAVLRLPPDSTWLAGPPKKASYWMEWQVVKTTKAKCY